jgi:mRNA interferase RelE/StbE
MSGWKILFEPAARRQLRDLPLNVRQRIDTYIDERLLVAQDPRSIGSKLSGTSRDFWRFRVGDYRLVAELRQGELVILMIRIAHRREVYR